MSMLPTAVCQRLSEAREQMKSGVLNSNRYNCKSSCRCYSQDERHRPYCSDRMMSHGRINGLSLYDSCPRRQFDQVDPRNSTWRAIRWRVRPDQLSI